MRTYLIDNDKNEFIVDLTHSRIHSSELVEYHFRTIGKDNKESSLAIAPTKVPGKWHHFIWKIAVILTLVFLIYGPLSLREEIADEVGRVVENMRDRDYAQAGDPWFEKLVAWSGTYAVARNKQASVSASATTSSGQPVAANSASAEKKGGWSSFPMHLASDTIVEILIAISRALFGR